VVNLSNPTYTRTYDLAADGPRGYVNYYLPTDLSLLESDAAAFSGRAVVNWLGTERKEETLLDRLDRLERGSKTSSSSSSDARLDIAYLKQQFEDGVWSSSYIRRVCGVDPIKMGWNDPHNFSDDELGARNVENNTYEKEDSVVEVEPVELPREPTKASSTLGRKVSAAFPRLGGSVIMPMSGYNVSTPGGVNVRL